MVQETRNYADSKDRPLIRSGVMDPYVLSRIARREAITIVTIVVVFLVSSIVYLHVAKKKYAVRMVITAVSSHAQRPAGTLDELSSLAGIDLPGEGSSQFKLFVGALRSPFAAETIAADQNLLKAMFPREWSATEARWRKPPSYILPIVHGIAASLGWYIVPWSPPGVSRVYDYLKDELKIIPDPKSGVVTLEIDSNRPDVAERVLLAMNDAVDERMRQHDLERATIDITYLSQRLSAVTVEEYRKALVSNLVDQERTRMLASAPLPYVSDALGKPMISSKPVSPIPVAVFAAALILGGLLGFGLASIKYYRQ
jgi:uncharacterized protein involved in exopolysaccharide biosynthesis